MALRTYRGYSGNGKEGTKPPPPPCVHHGLTIKSRFGILSLPHLLVPGVPLEEFFRLEPLPLLWHHARDLEEDPRTLRRRRDEASVVGGDGGRVSVVRRCGGRGGGVVGRIVVAVVGDHAVLVVANTVRPMY